MNKIQLKDKEFELFISSESLNEAIERMAVKIAADVEGKKPLFVGVLNGAFMFIADLMRILDADHELTFVRYSSYKGTGSTGSITEVIPLCVDVEGRLIIILEDIIDSGFTMHWLKDKLLKAGAKDFKVATMLFKPDALQYEDAKPDYVGLEIPNDFIVGHGLDYDGLGRAYKDIYRIANSI